MTRTSSTPGTPNSNVRSKFRAAVHATSFLHKSSRGAKSSTPQVRRGSNTPLTQDITNSPICSLSREKINGSMRSSNMSSTHSDGASVVSCSFSETEN